MSMLGSGGAVAQTPADAGVLECRVGILGTANIARKNILAMRDAAGVAPRAVASRSQAKAAAYAAETGLPDAVAGYGQLLARDDVDAVYCPLPTALHAAWLPRVAAAGKHVLCEKPCARSAAELLPLLRAFKANGLVFMDGVMFMHHPRLQRLLAALPALGAGGARNVSSAFSFRGDADFFAHNIRCAADGDPLGCIGDLGWYNTRASLAVFGYEMPATARCVVHQANAQGVPLHASCTLAWPPQPGVDSSGGGGGGGAAPPAPQATRLSTFWCSFLHTEQQWLHVSGDAGLIELDDFVIAKGKDAAEFTQVRFAWGERARSIDAQRETVAAEGNQETLMWETFGRLCRGGTAEERAFWMRVSLQTQTIMDALVASAAADGAAVAVAPVPDI